MVVDENSAHLDVGLIVDNLGKCLAKEVKLDCPVKADRRAAYEGVLRARSA